MAEETNTETTEETLPDVVVKLEQEAPVVKVEEPVKDAAVKDIAEQYKALEAEKTASDARAVEAERRAAAATRDADAARVAATNSNLSTMATALQSAQSAVDQAKRDKRIAREQGDFEAESEADDRLIQARIDVRTYDEAKANIEAQQKAPRQERPAPPTDIVEAYVANRSEQTAAWLRAHKDFILDGRKNAKLTAAHHDAIADGLTPDTPQYFNHVERFVGLKKDEAPVTEGDNVQRPGAAKEVQAKKPSQRSVAPVNGSGGSGGAVSGNEVRLSQREALAATDGTHCWNYDDPSGQKKFKKGDAIGIEEFARRKQKLTQQGAYDRSYETQ